MMLSQIRSPVCMIHGTGSMHGIGRISSRYNTAQTDRCLPALKRPDNRGSIPGQPKFVPGKHEYWYLAQWRIPRVVKTIVLVNAYPGRRWIRCALPVYLVGRNREEVLPIYHHPLFPLCYLHGYWSALLDSNGVGTVRFFPFI